MKKAIIPISIPLLIIATVVLAYLGFTWWAVAVGVLLTYVLGIVSGLLMMSAMIQHIIGNTIDSDIEKDFTTDFKKLMSEYAKSSRSNSS